MPDIKTVQEKLNTFGDQFQSVMISSLTKENEPFASYTPYVKVENSYYVIMSKIAQHYENVMHHPLMTIMFLEDESSAHNIFFRKRLTYVVETSITEDANIKTAFINRFGGFVERLFQMDFVMVKCVIKQGHFIIGPGQAYHVDENQHVILQMTGSEGSGHQTS